MGAMGTEVPCLVIRSLIIPSQEVTVVPYDPFAAGEQVYLGSLDIELSFVKPNYRTDQQFDSDELAKFFIAVTALR